MLTIMDKRIRIPFYGTISVFIETLTGTYFKLHVSPSETILQVKAKIQRLEGIPISQQHLIWEGSELEDNMCLHDYRIKRDASIKLVTTLRGGPINTRKITMNESSEYLDMSEEEFLDEFPFAPGPNDPDSQVTLLVYRNGDQINFFRVMDCGSGEITPVPFQLSCHPVVLAISKSCHQSAFRRQNSDESKPPTGAGKSRITMSRLKENQITAAKMKRLQNSFKHLRLKENAATEDAVEGECSTGEKSLAQSASSELLTSSSDHLSTTSKQDQPSNIRPSESSLKLSAKPSTESGQSHEVSPKISFNRHEMYLRSYGLFPRHIESSKADKTENDLIDHGATVPVDASGRFHVEDKDSNKIPPSRANQHSGLSTTRGSASILNRPKTFNQKEYLGRGTSDGETMGLQEVPDATKLPLISSNSYLTSKLTSASVLANRNSSRSAKMLDRGNFLKDNSKPGLSYSRSGFGEKPKVFASPRKPTMLSLHCDDHLQLVKIEGQSITGVEEAYKNEDQCESKMQFPTNQCLPSPPLLPPVQPIVIKKKRCFRCGKKTGLASSYLCRCGENFCASHRYAEAHACTFDYKATGRQVLKEANPIISSRKLPKI